MVSPSTHFEFYNNTVIMATAATTQTTPINGLSNLITEPVIEEKPHEISVPEWKYQPTSVKFDADKHLSIEQPAWRKTLADFGYDNSEGITKIGATAPFQLFTEEAVYLLRNDLLSEPVQKNHVFSWDRAPYIVRGFAPDVSKFVYDAWTHPRVLEALSNAAGIDLVPCFNYEIASTNIQLGSKGRLGVRDLSAEPSMPLPSSEKVEKSMYDEKPIDDWHFDCTPIVAVLMLSCTDGMIGGETAVQSKDGTRHVVPGPGMGKVVIMQGSKLYHAALRAKNCNERIAMVTGLRPRDPTARDTTSLCNVWWTSDRQIIGRQWLSYRLKNLEDCLRSQRSAIESSETYDREELKRWVQMQGAYLNYTIDQLFLDVTN